MHGERTGARRPAASWLVLAAVATVVAAGCERPPSRTTPGHVLVLEPDDPPPPPECREGVLEGLGEGGFDDLPQRGRQTIRAPSRELAARAARATAEGVDLTVTVSTAALTAALAAGSTVVFTDVADPVRAGVREPSLLARWLPAICGSEGPAVTGAYAVTDFGALLEIAAPLLPVEQLGAVFVAGDADSVAYRDQLQAVARRPVASAPLDPAAPASAVHALCAQRVRALVLLGDRSSDAVLPDVVAAAGACRMVLFGTRRMHAEAGALLTLARDERAAAVAAGRRAAAVMRGEQPQREPFERVLDGHLILNAQAAERAGVGLPLSLLEQADEVIGD